MSDSGERPRNASRRRLLAAAGTAGAALAAGCNGFDFGGGGSGSDGTTTPTETATATETETETATATETETATATETETTTATETETTGAASGDRLAVGETFAAPTGVRATVERVAVRQRGSTNRTAPGGQPVDVPNGRQAVAVRFRARNGGGSPTAAPDPSSITVRGDGRTFEPVGVGRIPRSYTGGSLDPNASTSGWLLYLLPQGIARTDLTVVWAGNGGGESWTATWAVGGN